MHASTTHLLWRCICTFLYILESLQGPHGYAVLKLVILSMKNNGVNVFTTVIPFIVFYDISHYSQIIFKGFTTSSVGILEKVNREIVLSENWICNFKMSLISIYIICFLLIQIVEWLLVPHLYKESENLNKTSTYPVQKQHSCN